MKLTVCGNTADVVSFAASYRDFIDGNEDVGRKWQEAFFEVLSWKNTLTKRFWECTIEADTKGGAFLYIVSPLEHEEWVENMLKGCGYKNIRKSVSKALLIDDPYYDNDGLDEILHYYLNC